MYYSGYSNYDTANGEGIRVSLFVSGCTLHCKGCFNREAWNFTNGKVFNKAMVDRILKDLEPDYIDGLSILGGDPFEEKNQFPVLYLITKIRERFGDTKTIWVWTGRLRHQVMNEPIYQNIDCLIDGPFIEKKKVIGQYYGSSNQKIWRINNERTARETEWIPQAVAYKKD